MRVNTHTPVQAHGEPGEALASVGAIRVHTASVHADPGGLALVNVFAIAPVRGQLEAGFADALEAAILVDAHPIQAHVPDAALVHIFAVLPIPRDMKACVAHAVEAAVRVDAAAVVADPAILQALINVSALRPGERALVASAAVAGVGAWGVDTLAPSARVLLTLVHIDALPPEVQLEAFVALAPVAPRRRNAASILAEIADQLAVISGDVEWHHH